jgi:hypothetical protein
MTAVTVVSAFPAWRGGDAAVLPAVLQRECRDLQGVYRPPGTLLVAECGGQLAGCVGLAAHAHDHAARHGMTRLILDVLPARHGVIGFYRRLGYTDTGPFETESPVPMIYMERPVTGTGRRQPAAPDDATAKREADPS